VQGLHILQIAILPLILFSVYMVCHGELVRLKPAPRYLTSFYLWLSAGGALGGIFVALIAPHVFTYFWELPIALLSSGALLGVVLWKDRSSWLHRLRPGMLVAVFLVSFVAVNSEATLYSAIDNVVSRSHFLLLLTAISVPLLVAVLVLRGRKRWHAHALRCQYALVFSTFLLLVALHLTLCATIAASRIAGSRNFFGVLTVQLEGGSRKILAHGTTLHGAQITIPPYTMLPTIYYDSESGVGLMLQAHGNLRGESSRQARIGVVGLGVGTLAAYSQPGNYMRFYEIDPAVVALSRGEHPQFTFLRDAAGPVDLVLGDARMELETEAARGAYGSFDVLVLDAFADDSVPLHLLTLEAMQTYLRHLSGPDAVIAVHMSSRSTDLSPVLARLARRCGMRAILVENDRDRVMKIRNEDVLVAIASSWVLMSRNEKSLLTPEVVRHGYTVPDGGSSEVWTDDYSNLLEVIRLKLDLLLSDSP
jgi:hypothetical protein